ncbi:MAG: hypothetical protein ABII18_08350 [bacterium]|nr:hypothetical protein [bacterium]MBU1918171.1 hypothetical protein [bacterium]
MMQRHCYALMLVVCLVFVSFHAQATEIEENDNTTEQGQVLLWKINKTGSKALLPDISLIGMVAGAYFRDDPANAQGPNPSRTGFNFQGAELAIQSVVDPYIRGDVFIHFMEDAFEVEELYITTLSLPLNLQFKVGKMRAHFGRENLQHVDSMSFVDYSRLRRYFLGNEGFVEWGSELSVLLPVKWFSEITFGFYQGMNDDNFNSPDKSDFAYLTHIKNAFDITVHTTVQLGLSGSWGNNGTASGNLTQIYGADFYVRWRPSDRKGIKWQTEYYYRRLQDVGTTAVEGGLTSQFIYQFAKRWETGVRFDAVGFPDNGFKQYQASPMLTFLATEFFRLRTQYNYLHIDGVAKKQHEVFLQMIFNMGPHGAHAF